MLPLDPILDEALDSYTFLRDAYFQHREALVDGSREDGEDGEDASMTDPAESWGAIAPQTQD